MIDFPASPTDGQIFSATNGVVYKWSAAYTSWLAQNPTPPLGGTGDFYATGSLIALTGSYATMILPTILTGNAGNYYNVANGRWTPPAGRYVLMGGVITSNAAASTVFVQLRKNGVAIGPSGNETVVANNYWADPQATLIVDANGADWFDMQASAGSGASGNSVWLAAFPLTGMQGPTGGAPGPVVGDFCAAGVCFINRNAYSTLNPPTVVTGNSGGYYVPATGIYKPPAGRYRIACIYSVYCDAASNNYLTVRKNGVQIPGVSGWSTTANASWSAQTAVECLVDANGSDTFDVQGYTTAGTQTMWSMQLTAFPTQGMVGPQGPPGVISNGFRLLSRQVLVSAAPYLQVQPFPADINDIQFSFDVNCSLNAMDLVMQFFDNTGTLDSTAGHYAAAVTVASHVQALGSAPAVGGSATVGATNGIIMTYSAPSRRVWNGGGIRGSGKIPNVQGPGSTGIDFQDNYVSDDGTVLMCNTGNGYRGTSGAITGLRLVFGSGNMLPGSVLSVWGSP